MKTVVAVLLLIVLTVATAQVVVPTFVGTRSQPSTGVTMFTKRVNIGGPQYTDGANQVWEADTSGYATYSVPSNVVIGNTNDPTLYRTEAYGANMTFSYNVPNGVYTVKLKFAEIYFTAVGNRVFNVAINGNTVETDFDILAHAAPNTAYDKTYTYINVTGATISISLTQGLADQPKLSAVEITQTSSTVLTTRYIDNCTGGADDTAAVQTALNSTQNGDTLIFNCLADVSSSVTKSGAENIRIAATAGNGIKVSGTPTTAVEILSLSSCTSCIVENMVFDGNNRAATMIALRSSTSTVIQNNTFRNLGSSALYVIKLRGNTLASVLTNEFQNLAPVFDTSGNVSAYTTIAISAGSGSEWENVVTVEGNTATSSGNVFISVAATGFSVVDNVLSGLVKEAVEVTNTMESGDSSFIQGNQFSGSMSGWKEANGQNPVHGGGIKLALGSAAVGEQFTVTGNTVDGGEVGLWVAGPVGTLSVTDNSFINQWRAGVQITGASNASTISVDHNWIDQNRTVSPPTPNGQFPLPHAVSLLASGPYTLSNVTVAYNWAANAWRYGLSMQTSASGVINGVNFNNNAFASNGSFGVYINQGSATTITNITHSSNCYTGNGFREAGGGTLYDSRGTITPPATSGVCANPSGRPSPFPGTVTNISSIGACGTNVTTALQSFINNTFSDGQTLNFDCRVGLSAPVTFNGFSNITVTAPPGLGFGFDVVGTPGQVDFFKFTNCTSCKIQYLTIDAKGQPTSTVYLNTTTDMDVSYLNISNVGYQAYAAILGHNNTRAKIHHNTLTDFPANVDGNGDQLDYGSRGIWMGEGSNIDYQPEIYNNTVVGSGHTMIVCGCTGGWIHHNRGTNLGGAGVKLSLQLPNLPAAVTIVEDNIFVGAADGRKTADGGSGTRPVNGGDFQNGSCDGNTPPPPGTGCAIANFYETALIRRNVFDGGDCISLVAGVYNMEISYNVIKNQWTSGIKMEQRDNKGYLKVHHNRFGKDRPPYCPTCTAGGAIAFPGGFSVWATTGRTYTDVQFYNNYVSGGYYDGMSLNVDAGSITGAVINDNSFVANGPFGFRVNRINGGTLTVTQTGNCFTGHTSGSVDNPNGVDLGTVPNQVGSCSVPAGVPDLGWTPF